jgi:hypothetical protein
MTPRTVRREGVTEPAVGEPDVVEPDVVEGFVGGVSTGRLSWFSK